MTVMLRSVVRGLFAMKRNRARVNYVLVFERTGFWADAWTPTWHDGRGPYISIGFFFGAFARGY